MGDCLPVICVGKPNNPRGAGQPNKHAPLPEKSTAFFSGEALTRTEKADLFLEGCCNVLSSVPNLGTAPHTSVDESESVCVPLTSTEKRGSGVSGGQITTALENNQDSNHFPSGPELTPVDPVDPLPPGKQFVICYANSKRPIGHDWGNRLLTWEEVNDVAAVNPALNVGVVLGLDLIDVEIDSEEATKTYGEWFAGIIAPCWQAARGCHYLYRRNPRLSHLSAVVKTHGLEFRLGNGGQTQSIYPPSVVDGVQRTWIIPLGDCEIPDLPESVVAELLKQPAAKQHKIVAADIPAAKNRTVKRLLDYCRRVGIVVKGVYVEPDGTVYIDVVCPFKHPDNVTGDAAFIVNPDGSFGFHCFHAGCASKTKADVFDLLGPLYPRVVVGSDLCAVSNTQYRALQVTTLAISPVGS